MKAFQFRNTVYIVTSVSKQQAKNKGEEDEGRGRHASEQKIRNLKHNQKNGERIKENIVSPCITLNEWPRFQPVNKMFLEASWSSYMS